MKLGRTFGGPVFYYGEIMQHESFLYCWTNLLTEKLYIGVHKGDSDDGYVCSSKLMMKEYGENPQNFFREVLAQGTYPKMYQLETSLLSACGAAKNPHFYNMHNNVGPFFHGGKQTEEHIAKRVAKNLGKKRSPETKERMRLVARNQYSNPEKREAYLGINNPGYGKPRSLEVRLKISAAKKGTVLSEEHKKKIRNTMIGKKRDPYKKKVKV